MGMTMRMKRMWNDDVNLKIGIWLKIIKKKKNNP